MNSTGAGGTAAARVALVWEEASENHARTLGSRGWERFGRHVCLRGKKAVAEW